MDDVWFQQNCAIGHIVAETRRRLLGILRQSEMHWPPISWDLKPLDFFIGGFWKGKVYANDPQTIPESKTEIRRD